MTPPRRITPWRIEAARLLAYYFSDESAELLAERIRGLDLERVPDADDGEAWLQREIRNGCDTAKFLKTVRTARAPAVQAALLDAVRRTDDPELFLALLPVVMKEDRPLASERL